MQVVGSVGKREAEKLLVSDKAVRLTVYKNTEAAFNSVLKSNGNYICILTFIKLLSRPAIDYTQKTTVVAF